MPQVSQRDDTSTRLTAQRRQQVGAALLLGVIVLVVILLRARGVFFGDGWWRFR